MNNIPRIIEVTATLIILYLVLVNYQGFAAIVSAISSGYTASVKALQGRP